MFSRFDKHFLFTAQLTVDVANDIPDIKEVFEVIKGKLTNSQKLHSMYRV